MFVFFNHQGKTSNAPGNKQTHFWGHYISNSGFCFLFRWMNFETCRSDYETQIFQFIGIPLIFTCAYTRLKILAPVYTCLQMKTNKLWRKVYMVKLLPYISKIVSMISSILKWNRNSAEMWLCFKWGIFCNLKLVFSIYYWYKQYMTYVMLIIKI